MGIYVAYILPIIHFLIREPKSKMADKMAVTLLIDCLFQTGEPLSTCNKSKDASFFVAAVTTKFSDIFVNRLYVICVCVCVCVCCVCVCVCVCFIDVLTLNLHDVARY